MKFATLSTILFATISATDVTSDYLGEYYNIDILDSSSGCMHQALSSSNGTAPTTESCDENTDNIYEFVDFDDGAKIRHINDNKCLYIEATTNLLKSWECNADGNMEFTVQNVTGYGLRLKHTDSGLCIDEVSGVLKGVSCSGTGHLESGFLTQVYPYNTVTTAIYSKIKFLPGTYCVSGTSQGSCSLPLLSTIFRIDDQTNNIFSLRSVDQGKCLHLDSNDDAAFDFCGTDSKFDFYLYKHGSDNRLVHKDTGLCMVFSGTDLVGHECGSTSGDEVAADFSSITNVYTDDTSLYSGNTYEVEFTDSMCLLPYRSVSTCDNGATTNHNIEFQASSSKIKLRVASPDICCYQDTDLGMEANSCSTHGEDHEVIKQIYTDDLKIRNVSSGLCLARSGNDAVYADCDSTSDVVTTLNEL